LSWGSAWSRLAGETDKIRLVEDKNKIGLEGGKDKDRLGGEKDKIRLVREENRIGPL
jgi:hypothetical protein